MQRCAPLNNRFFRLSYYFRDDPALSGGAQTLLPSASTSRRTFSAVPSEKVLRRSWTRPTRRRRLIALRNLMLRPPRVEPLADLNPSLAPPQRWIQSLLFMRRPRPVMIIRKRKVPSSKHPEDSATNAVAREQVMGLSSLVSPKHQGGPGGVSQESHLDIENTLS